MYCITHPLPKNMHASKISTQTPANKFQSRRMCIYLITPRGKWLNTAVSRLGSHIDYLTRKYLMHTEPKSMSNTQKLIIRVTNAILMLFNGVAALSGNELWVATVEIFLNYSANLVDEQRNVYFFFNVCTKLCNDFLDEIVQCFDSKRALSWLITFFFFATIFYRAQFDLLHIVDTALKCFRSSTDKEIFSIYNSNRNRNNENFLL